MESGDLSREQDELKQKCEVLELENSETEKELVELRVKVKLVNYLQEDVDRYDSPSIFAA